MNNRKTGLVLAYMETILNMVCGLFLSSFLLRILGDFEYGLYQSMSAFVNYLVILEFGTGTVMCRHLLVAKGSEDPNEKNRITSTLWYITLALSMIIFVVGVAFALGIRHIYANTIPPEKIAYATRIFLVMLLYLLVSFLTQTLSGAFIGNENYNIGNIINIFKILLRTSLLLVTVLLIKYSIVIAICDALISLLIFAFTAVYVKRKYDFSFKLKYFDKEVLRNSMPLCIALLLQTIINQANSNVDKFIIGIRMSMESVSFYSVSLYIYSMFSSITTKPITMYMPQVSDNMRKGLLGGELKKTLVPSGRLVALIGGTILFGYITVGRQFIEIVYGEDYSKTWIVALILLVPTFINMTGGVATNVLDVLNKRQIRSYILIITTIVNIVLTLCFINILGIIGAAVATAISLVVGHIILLNIYYYKELSINVWSLYLDAYKGIVPAEFFAMIVGFALSFFIKNTWLSFLVGGIIFIVSEFIFLMLFGFNTNEKKLVNILWIGTKKLWNKKIMNRQ